ncbi:FimD/PapC N-terminal domain-containing protein, partial [Pseudomonas poae]
MVACVPAPALADDAAQGFNTTFLQGAQSQVDLQQLLAADSVLPGNYRVDLY